MDFSTLGQFIGSVGFPVVAFLLMWKQLSEERESHEKEMHEVVQAVNNNTTALVQLSERMSIATEGSGKH